MKRVRQRERKKEREEARERAEDCLTSSCQKREKSEQQQWKEMHCAQSRPVDTTMLSVEKTQKACKAVCIKDTIIQFLTHSVTITQLDLYLQCTNDSFAFTPFIPPDNHLSIPLTLTFSYTLALSHPLPYWTDNTVSFPHLFLIGLSVDENKATARCDWTVQGSPGETPPTLYVHSKTWVSNFHSLACMLHQTKTWLNRHFRCAGVFLTLDSLCRQLTGETNLRR